MVFSVCSKHAVSLNAFWLNSLMNFFGSAMVIFSSGRIMGKSASSARSLAIGQAILRFSKPDFFTACSYNSCAAKIGRQYSTSLSLPIYFIFSTCQRAYTSFGKICCKVLPSGFFLAFNREGIIPILEKKPTSASKFTEGGAIKACDSKSLRSSLMVSHCIFLGIGLTEPKIHRW